jgi:tripartite-type tricarboxylate transporter receptor subunit TctC
MRLARMAAAVVIAVAFANVAEAQPADEFYKGKRITIVVGSAAGSGYDAYARLVARHMGKHIPGNPLFIVQNMTCLVAAA